MIVRELLTRIGYDVDPKSEQKAKQGLDRVKSAAQSLGLVLSAGLVAAGFKRAIDAASDVEETMNVVTTAFENQADAVLRWAQVAGEASGRSQFAMREYAATVGAVVGPTLGSAEATAQLSQDMAQLAVDLGSFFNATDDEALQALRAGLIGSQEPLLRFGVNMSVAALDAFALEQGINKQTKEMTAAEKTMLRYRFIMARTTKAQGDAAKTSDGFANQTKRLEGNIRDIAVGIGEVFLPTAAKTLQTINDLAKEMKGPLVAAVGAVMNVFRFFGAILIGLGEAFLSLGGTAQAVLSALLFFSLAFFAPWLLMPILIGAAIAGLIVIVDDLWSGLTKGEGVLAGLVGEFEHWLTETDSTTEAMGQIFATAIDFWGEKITGFGDTTEMLGLWLVDIFDRIGQGIRDAWDAVISTILDGMVEVVGYVSDTLEPVINAIFGTMLELVGMVSDLGLGDIVGSAGRLLGFGGPESITAPGSPAAAAGGNVNANQNIEVNVNAPGGDGPGIAAAVAPAVGSAAAAANRRTAQQLLVGGSS